MNNHVTKKKREKNLFTWSFQRQAWIYKIKKIYVGKFSLQIATTKREKRKRKSEKFHLLYEKMNEWNENNNKWKILFILYYFCFAWQYMKIEKEPKKSIKTGMSLGNIKEKKYEMKRWKWKKNVCFQITGYDYAHKQTLEITMYRLLSKEKEFVKVWQWIIIIIIIQ